MMYLRMVLGGAAGALFGFFMYRVVGCRTGACPLYGNPYTAMILWALMGILLMAKP